MDGQLGHRVYSLMQYMDRSVLTFGTAPEVDVFIGIYDSELSRL